MSKSTEATSRRQFMATSAAGIAAVPTIGSVVTETRDKKQFTVTQNEYPAVAVSSGNGLEATRLAYKKMTEGADTLDSVVAGVNLVEEDPKDTSVGYGGLPNERGVIQLDSAVMHGPTHQAGAVASLEGIKYPSRVAKMVCWRTDHVLLVGPGALDFAKAHGFKEEDLMTERTRQIWLKWKEGLSKDDDWLDPSQSLQPGGEGQNDRKQSQLIPNPLGDRYNQHGVYDNGEDVEVLAARILANRPTGTIHCAGMNSKGDISCVTTTSGLAWKIPGRVGDSPIIGAGLYVDNEIGSCGSTGRGEANLHNLCSFAAVELMRGGMEPKEAGLEVLRRVAKHSAPRLLDDRGNPNFGLQFYLIRKDGMYAGVSMRGKGKFAVTDKEGTRRESLVSLFE